MGRFRRWRLASSTCMDPPAAPTLSDPVVPPSLTLAVAAVDTSECRLLSERLENIEGKGFKGPPLYFGPNSDPDKILTKQNQAGVAGPGGAAAQASASSRRHRLPVHRMPAPQDCRRPFRRCN